MTMKTASKLTTATLVAAKRIAKHGMHSLVCAVVAGMMVGRAQAANGTWDTNGNGNWTDPLNWVGNTDYAFGADFTATFGDFISADRAITLNAAITIGNITASDASNNYTLSGANILTLDRTSGVPTIDVTTSGRTLTISSQISGSDGLQKNGAGSLVLSSAANNYTGGIVLNGGTLSFGANTHLGAAANAISVTGTSTLAYTGGATVHARAIDIASGSTLSISGASGTGYSGALTGSGTLNNAGSSQPYIFSSTGNTFTGPVNAAYGMTFASLGDGNTYNFGNSSVGLTWTGGAQIFANRVFTMSAAGNAPIFNNGNGALTIQQNLAISGTAGARTLSLGGSNTTSLNQFAGNIVDGTSGGTSVVSLTKAGDNSRWALSGTSTYTGATTLTAGGSTADAGLLIFQGIQALSSSTSLNIAQGGSNQRWGIIRILDDSATPASRSAVNLNFSNTENVATSDNRYWMRVFVGNNSTANLGTSASTQTGSTIQLGNLTLTEGNTASTGQGLWVSGANGYGLQIANVNVTLQAATAVNHQATLRADNPMTITGTVRQTNDAAVGSTTTLQLEGSAAGSLISGNILNSAGGRLLNLSMAGTGTWTLSGANDYTGTTTVTAGKLLLGSAGSLASGSAVTVSGGALGGTGTINGTTTVSSTGGIDLRDGSVGTLTLGSTLNITGAASANNLRFDMGNGTGTSDSLSVGGTTTLTNAQVIDLNWLGGTSGRTEGTYTLIGGVGALDATNFGKFSLLSTKAFGQTYTLVHDASTENGNLQVTVANVTASANNVTLQNSNPSWTSTANFNPAYLPDYESNVTIASNIGTTGALNASQDINSLKYTTAATTGTTITPGTAAAGTASNMLTIEAAEVNGNTAGNGITLQNTSGTHTISANIGLAASQTWTVATGGGLTVSGVISDFGFARSLTKAGGGTLTISTKPTYTGATIINGGTLDVSGQAGNPLSASSGITFTGTSTLKVPVATITTPSMTINPGVTANFNYPGNGGIYTFTIPSLSGSGTFSADNPGGTGQGKNVTFSDLSAFTGVLQMNLSGASLNFNVYNLNDTVANNIRFAGNGGNIGANSPNRFQYVGSAGLTLNNRAIEYANGAGAGLAINNNGTGTFTINKDLLVTATGNKTLQLGGSNTGNNTFAGAITNGSSAVISLIKADAGKWILSGTNTYTGVTTIVDGTLEIRGAGQLGGGNYAGNISNTDTTPSSFTFDSSANQTLSGVISGTMAFIKDGAGTLSLTADNTYSGNTTVNAGTLVGVGGSCSNSAVTVASTGTLGVTVTDTKKQWTCKSVTVSTGTAAKLKFAFTGVPSTTDAPLKITGALTFTGLPTVVVDAPALGAGTYPLLVKGDGTALVVPPLSFTSGTLAWSGDNKTLNLIIPPMGTLIQIF